MDDGPDKAMSNDDPHIWVHLFDLFTGKRTRVDDPALFIADGQYVEISMMDGHLSLNVEDARFLRDAITKCIDALDARA